MVAGKARSENGKRVAYRTKDRNRSGPPEMRSAGTNVTGGDVAGDGRLWPAFGRSALAAVRCRSSAVGSKTPSGALIKSEREIERESQRILVEPPSGFVSMVQLTWKIVETGSNYPRQDFLREVLERPVLQLVPHLGYVSLFPFILRLIPPDSWILERQLDLISNRSILWTDFGLRSLSKTSSMYMKRNTEHDPPYWRGPIWIPLNYLIVSSLHHYSQESGPYRERAKTVYNELRSNLIRNIVGNYKRTGYLWEQYDQKKGKGKGARLFTG